ncbi:MAG: FAD-dependent monooxygenase [Simkaniaceae bacterium]|nr:FAD-dependent monooxygenase [Simkaniaceae bacterium]
MDVLIIGAGPTGLMMAAELKRYGIDFRIIDKSKGPSEKSKALAIQARTLEIFQMLDLDEAFTKKGLALNRMNIFSQNGPIGSVSFQGLASPFPYVLSLPQSETETILNDHLGNLVEREVELTGIEQGDDHIRATLSTGESVTCRYLIGCDGAHSFVRKHLGLTFIGKSFPSVFSLADVTIDWSHPHEEGSVFWHPSGVLAALPLPAKNTYRLIFELPRCQMPSQANEDNLKVDIPAPTLEEVQEMVRERADKEATLSSPDWLANFHVNSRLASNYQKGNIFLAGDAAHIHSPVGGQGMNTGIQDAFNLAWKLAHVLRGKADNKLLETYHLERHAFAKKLLKGTEKGTYIAALKRSWQITLRNFFAKHILRTQESQRKIPRVISQIDLSYPNFPYDGKFARGPKSGMRLPHYKELLPHLKDLQEHLLILFSTDPKPFADLPCTLVNITRETDTTGELHEAFGAESGAAYLVRPDGYIAYRQTPAQPEKLIEQLKKFTYSGKL